MQSKKSFTPILLGADLCAYSVARAFHEHSGVVSHAFGRYKCGLTGFSKIVKSHVCSGLDDDSVIGPELFDFASEHKNERFLIVACSDMYIEVAARVAENFRDVFVTLLPKKELRYLLRDKAIFYEFLEKYKIRYPKTVTVSYTKRCDDSIERFTYPAVIKPTDSAHYWKYCHFKGMRKVYFASDFNEAKKIINKIYDSDYRGKIVVQQKIGEEDAVNSVLTVFFQNGRAVRAVYGRVILEETGMTSFGNHAAIITQPLTPICKSLINMFEKLEYNGLANFDIISDKNKDYVLEVNLRQGRSCDYLRAAGLNIAALIEDSLNGEEIGRSLEKTRRCSLYEIEAY